MMRERISLLMRGKEITSKCFILRETHRRERKRAEQGLCQIEVRGGCGAEGLAEYKGKGNKDF